MSKEQALLSPELLDLSNHAFIGASAGAGKTYTLENLVVRLLKGEIKPGEPARKAVPYDEILMVTFTEKATGELRHRIRKKLEEEIEAGEPSKDLKEHLSRCLNQFDRAHIYTIHGFCQKILSEYGFETGNPGNRNLADDAEVFEKAFYRVLRNYTKAYSEDELAGWLEVSGIVKQKDTVLRLAQNVKSELNQLRPQMSEEEKNALIGLIQSEVNRLCDSLNDFGWNESFSEIAPALNGNVLGGIQSKIFAPLAKLLSSDLESRFFDFLKLCKELSAWDTFQKNGLFEILIQKLKKKEGPIILEKLPALPTLCQKLNELYLLVENSALGLNFISETLHLVQEEAQAYKTKQHLMSYDDMIADLYYGLQNSPALLKALQKDFTYAFIDEFQDTDGLQWGIFKKIFFKESEHTGNRIFLIGDHKQAIYGFRGADVYTYLEARKELKASGNANFYHLPYNFRSMPQMVKSFNDLFASNWFSSDEMTYDKVKKLPDKKRISRLFADESGRQHLNLLDLEEIPSVGAARMKTAELTALEIKHLMESNIIIGKGQHAEKLNYHHMTVLTRNRSSDQYWLEKKFQEHSIPYTVYKKTGIFQSDEALQLSYVLRALPDLRDASALNKLLFTRFFDVAHHQMEKAEELIENPDFKALIAQWSRLAGAKQWSGLFYSLLYDTGTVLRETENFAWERHLSNFHQITEALSSMAYLENLDIYGLIHKLESLRQRAITEQEDTGLYRLESDEPKVQIMSIHAAKGLEFPVVFLCGGFSDAPGGSYWEYYEETSPGKKEKIFDLNKTEEKRAQKEAYIQQENERLFYVALTRASHKLYLPSGNYGKGKSGFIQNHLAPIIENYETQNGKLPRLQLLNGNLIYDGTTPPAPLDAFSASSKYQTVETKLKGIKVYGPGEAGKNHSDGVILSDVIRVENPDSVPIHSFSSLHAGMHEEKSDETKPTEEEKAQSDILAIPGGASTGSCLHEVLEKMDFALAENFETLKTDPELDLLVQKKMKKYQISDIPETIETGWIQEQHWFDKLVKMGLYGLKDNVFILQKLQESRPIRLIARTFQEKLKSIDAEFIPKLKIEWLYKNQIKAMLFHTLNAPMLSEKNALNSIPKAKRLEEAEFLLSLGGTHPAPGKENFVTGSIDLIFEHQGKFYLLDWKSNQLPDGNSPEAVAAIVEKEYALQYQIYSVALKEWLQKQMGKAFDFEKHFGGVYYVFLRGTESNSANNGVFFKTLTEDEVNGFERAIALLVNEK